MFVVITIIALHTRVHATVHVGKSENNFLSVPSVCGGWVARTELRFSDFQQVLSS